MFSVIVKHESGKFIFDGFDNDNDARAFVFSQVNTDPQTISSTILATVDVIDSDTTGAQRVNIK
jgi:hypothetical protein